MVPSVQKRNRLSKTLKLTVDAARFFKKTRKALTQGDYQGFYKIRIIVPNIKKEKRKDMEKDVYLEVLEYFSVFPDIDQID